MNLDRQRSMASMEARPKKETSEGFVLLRVFSILNPEDLLRASRVCKGWNQICSDPIFEWAKVLTCKAECTQARILLYDTRVKRISKVGPISYIVEDVHGKLGEFLIEPVSGCNFEWCMEAANLSDVYPKLWKCTVRATPLSTGTTRICIKAELNLREFHRLRNTRGEGRTESEYLFANALQWKTDRVLFLNNLDAVKPINFSGGSERDIDRLTEFKLYDYQREAVSWMRTIEQKNANSQKFRGMELDYVQLPHQPTILYSRKYRRFVDSHEAHPYLPFLMPKGGFLMDDIGLGKTLEILALVLLDRIPLEQVDHKVKCTILGDVVTPVYLFSSKATLVLCPPHIVLQWKREIQRYTDSSFKGVALSSMKDLAETSYGDVQSADVVIVSYSLITAPWYCSIGEPETNSNALLACAPACALDGAPGESRRTNLCQLLATLKKEPHMGLSRKFPVLELFFYHRIVIDEAHLLSDDKLCKAVGFFNATNWWAVSSSPIEPSATRLKIASYLGLINSMDKRYSDRMIHDYFMWRNTEVSASANKYLPPLSERTVLIPNFISKIEHVMYEMMEMKAEMHQDLFCSYPFQKRRNQTLEQWHTSAIESVFMEMVRTLARIKKSERKSEKHKKAHQRLLTMLSVATLTTDRKAVEKKCAISQAKRAKHDEIIEKTGKAFSEILWQYNILCGVEQKADASVDLSDYNILKPVTDRAVRKYGSGPTKRRKSKNKMRIQELEEEMLREHDKPSREPNALMIHCANLFGTKITHLMIYLRIVWSQESSEKIVIFSQHTEVLATISFYLRKCGVDSVVITAEQAETNDENLDNFTSNDALRVLLSDYASSASMSGASIIHASHVVYLDPINSRNRTQALHLENIALGKTYRIGQPKSVSLVKFIISNSAEHQQYLAIHPEHNSKYTKRNSIPKLVPLPSPNTFLQSQKQMKDLVDKYCSPRKERAKKDRASINKIII